MNRHGILPLSKFSKRATLNPLASRFWPTGRIFGTPDSESINPQVFTYANLSRIVYSYLSRIMNQDS